MANLLNEMLAALKVAELATAELCAGQDPANQCWVTLSEIRTVIAKAERLPTQAEAAQAADLLMRCNGHDLDVWTGGEWPVDSHLFLRPLAAF